MKLSQYGYDFTPDMLAKYPAENRDEARLMVVNRATGQIEHRIFKDIIDYFEEKDVFVFNDTKVFPARLYGNKEKTGAEIEIVKRGKLLYFAIYCAAIGAITLIGSFA